MRKHGIFTAIISFWACIAGLALLSPVESHISMSFITTAITMFTCGSSFVIHQAIDCFFEIPKTKDEKFVGFVIKFSNFFFAIGYFIYIFLLQHNNQPVDLLHDISRLVLNICTILISMSVTAQQVLLILKKYRDKHGD